VGDLTILCSKQRRLNSSWYSRKNTPKNTRILRS
jgi:hypothetical protein